MLIGAHCSIAGGLSRAIERASALGCTALQIFTRNQRQWVAKAISDMEAESFKTAVAESEIAFIVSHASYLINLGAAKETLRWKSSEALIAEVERCEALALPAVVVHGGAHNGAGSELGIKRVAETLEEVFRRTKDCSVSILVENTAGQGSALGASLDELARLLELLPEEKRLGFCIDTCHAFAAGYDICSQAKWRKFVSQIKATIGLSRVGLFHLNDCKGTCGEKKDRHDHLGEGQMGEAAFRFLLKDERFSSVPKIIETPKEGGRSGKPSEADKLDQKNLAFIKSILEEE